MGLQGEELLLRSHEVGNLLSRRWSGKYLSASVRRPGSVVLFPDNVIGSDCVVQKRKGSFPEHLRELMVFLR